MPRKVPFRVIYSSGWDENYSAKDLEVQSPYSKGWRSPRYCLYPQELVVRIDPPGHIRKIQLLSHQYLIATMVELYVGKYTSDAHTSTNHTKFMRLGYISLSDNESRGFRLRELKSVNVDCVGELLKLTLHQNHINQLNLYNQIGVVALNIIADPVSPVDASSVISPSPKSGADSQLAGLIHTHHLPDISDPVLKGTVNRLIGISPLDDLSFAIAQDPETADLVRKLERMKASVIEDENFQEATRLKMVIDELCKAGEVLCRYEVEKKGAVAREDYDTAKDKKDKLDAARKLIYEQLNIHGLIGGGSVHSRPHTSSGSHQSMPRVRRSGPFSTIDGKTFWSVEDKGHSNVLPPIKHSTSPLGVEKSSSDDRPLPALVRKSMGLSKLEVTKTEEEAEDIKFEPLTEKQINEVSLAVEIFGMELMKQLYAKQYSIREKSLSSILDILATKEKGVSRREMIKATCQVLIKSFKEKVFSIFSMSQDLLKYLIGPFAQRHNTSNQEFTFIVEKVGPVLLIRTGDLSPRILTASLDLFTELMRHHQIRELSLCGPMLIEPFKKTPSWRLIRGRILLIEKLMKEPGLASSGLNVRKIMQFTSQYLNHGSNDVRDVVIRLTMELYRINGTEVRGLMPVPDDTTSRKKTLWRTIFEGFDKIDGKPTRAEREVMNKVSQNAKNEEISKLQKELQMLRNISANGNTIHAVTNEDVKKTDLPYISDVGNEELDRMCVFCGKQQDGLQSEVAMETHYLEECPMLKSCLHCHQVIEISGLTKHWLTECEAKDKFKECPCCKEAINKGVFDSHMESGTCQLGGGDLSSSNKCPLCHSNIPMGDESWQIHIMGQSGTCPKRKRKTQDTTS